MRLPAAATLLLFPTLACALSLSFPEKPQAVRQTYADGSWTEVARACAVSEKEETCDFVFRVHEGRRTVEHALALRGLRTVAIGQPYNYYRGEDGWFKLVLEVKCAELDNARIGAKPYESAACYIDFIYDGKAMETPEYISVFDGSVDHSYDLEPEWPPGAAAPSTMTFTGYVRRPPSDKPCTEPAAVIYEVDESDAGEAWSERTMAVRVPCELLDPKSTATGGARLPYKEFDDHRVRVVRTTMQYGEDFIGTVASYWLVEETVPVPDPAAAK